MLKRCTIDRITVTIDGKALVVPAGTSVAAAMTLAYGIRGTRVSESGMPRAPLCGMGVCQECRVTVNDRAHVLACQIVCGEGMSIFTERADGDA
ncbi:(2Fe-2S)-binding protein [Trinickia sp. LjRoot230]|uniref:(2Fe-2S)-binding protein n=1 Tax=Trinickia sp. LjRoot230 TaxID=3342288 RepID=UPI003ECCE578